MRTAFVALLSLVSTSFAYDVTSPSAGTKWYSGQVTNQLAWNKVSTDPLNFTVVMVNQDRSVMSTDQQLIAMVDGAAGKMDVPAPSGGFPVGKGFRVNLVKSPTEMNTILAQSPEFEIVSGTSTSSGTMSMISSVHPAGTTQVVAPSTAPTTSSPDEPNQMRNGAVSIIGRASPILGVGALLVALVA